MADSGTKLVEPVVFQGVHASLPHDSALRHVSGAAIYVDDIPEPAACSMSTWA
jgi:xanthine dehydrogenase large subunit